jgi:hypothetical protein
MKIIGHVYNVVHERSHLCDREALQVPVGRRSGNRDLLVRKEIPQYSKKGEIVGTIAGTSCRNTRNIRCL